MTREFRAHGTHIGTGYAQSWPTPPDPSPSRESVEDDDGTPIHTFRYDKSEQAASTPRSLGRLRQVYADAIEYTGMRTKTDGLALVLAVTLGMPLVVAGAWIGVEGVFDARVSGGEALLIFLMCALVAWMGVWMCSDLMDDLLFALEALPVVFDRKHRKIYRLLPGEGTGFLNVVRRRPLVACEYDWDLVDVERRTRPSNTLHMADDCALVFRVRASTQSRQMIDVFDIAVTGLAKGGIDPLWEHIRRYMEEGGPALPDPADAPARPAAPRSWWGCLRMGGEHAPLFLTHSRGSPLRGAFLLLLFLVGLPFRLVWGTGDYLARRTTIPVRWPAPVQERIGPPLPVAPQAKTGSEGGAGPAHG